MFSRKSKPFISGLCFGLFMVVYQLTLLLVMPFLLFKGLKGAENPDERKRALERFLAFSVFKCPRPEKEARQTILIHAVSLGEAKVAWELAKRLDGDKYRICVTVTTLSGFQYLQGVLPDTRDVVYLPIDFLPYMFGLLSRLNVRKLYVVEHDLWPGLLVCAHALGIRSFLINGHFSTSSLKVYKKISFISAFMLDFLDELHLQHEHELAALLDIGVRPEKMSVTGSLKLLTASDAVRSHLPDRFDVCFGSCHDVEYPYLVSVVAAIAQARPASKVLLVPRHPDNAGQLVQALQKEGIEALFTKDIGAAVNSTCDVVVLSQFGILMDAYSQSLIGVVCGSFEPPLKGHNLLEPLQCGAVSLHGPRIEAQHDMAIFMRSHGLEGEGLIGEALLRRILFYLDNPAARVSVVEKYPAAITARKKKMEDYFTSLRND